VQHILITVISDWEATVLQISTLHTSLWTTVHINYVHISTSDINVNGNKN